MHVGQVGHGQAAYNAVDASFSGSVCDDGLESAQTQSRNMICSQYLVDDVVARVAGSRQHA